MFPDVSNTCYSSHGDAAIELITWLEFYHMFMECIKNMKDKAELNHMEHNVQMALHDIPTVTELGVMALYSICFSHPYMDHA